MSQSQNKGIKYVLATSNRGKIREIKNYFSKTYIKFVEIGKLIKDFNIEEKGDSFKENALLKAKWVWERLNTPAIAEDSGLCVEYLGGAPGISSHRWTNEKTDFANRKKLLKLLDGVPLHKRNAFFISVFVVVFSRDKYCLVEGKTEGFILEEERGIWGFGYDPVFLYPPLGCSFAEIPVELKNSISHRGKALKRLKDLLIQLNESNIF